MDCRLNQLISLAPGFSVIGLFRFDADRAAWILPAATILLILVIFWICRRKIRTQQQDLDRAVETKTRELVELNAAKTEFLAAISHEIRNPMNGIIGIAESFRIERLDSDSQHKLDLLRQCARYLSSLLEDVLDFSRAQPHGFKLDSKPFDLPELMKSVAALTATESKKRGIPVEIAISPAVPRKLTGDPRRIQQILLNYIYNALKYSSEGEVCVTVWRNQKSPGAAEIFFAVSDDGPGIPADQQANLFTRFERNRQSDGSPGNGLGLFICRALADKMDGRVWFKSETGKGSCFYFSATFAIADESFSPSGPSLVPLPGNLRSALVIDDQEYNRIALAGMLETLGLSVRTSGDWQEALAFARAHDIDVIFIDYSIPGLDGPAIAAQIRAMPGRSARATMFATTAFNTTEKRTLCLAAGMDGFLTKPVTIDRLRRALGAGIDKVPEKSSALHQSPCDPLVNLRLLATKKGVSFSEELNSYFLEFESELANLATALQKEQSDRASYFAHLLYGRCSFINENDLETSLRKIEVAAATERWDEARAQGREIQTKLGDLRVKSTSGNPVARPG